MVKRTHNRKDFIKKCYRKFLSENGYKKPNYLNITELEWIEILEKISTNIPINKLEEFVKDDILDSAYRGLLQLDMIVDYHDWKDVFETFLNVIGKTRMYQFCLDGVDYATQTDNYTVIGKIDNPWTTVRSNKLNHFIEHDSAINLVKRVFGKIKKETPIILFNADKPHSTLHAKRVHARKNTKKFANLQNSVRKMF